MLTDPALPQADRSSTRPTQGRLRLLRIGVLAASAVGLAYLAHLLGGGPEVAPAPLLVMLVLVTAAAIPLTRRRCRPPQVIVVLALGQWLLHCLLRGADVLHGAAAHSLPDLAAASTSAACHAAACHAGVPVGPGSWPMITAHAGATVVTAWLLWRGEAALWGLADRIIAAAAVQPRTWPRTQAYTPVSVVSHHVPVAWPHEAAPRGPPVPICLRHPTSGRTAH